MSGALHEYSVHDSLKSSLAFRKLATTAVSEPPQAGCDEGSGCDEKGPLRFGGLSIVFLWQRCHSRHGQLRDRWPNCAAFRGVRAFHLASSPLLGVPAPKPWPVPSLLPISLSHAEPFAPAPAATSLCVFAHARSLLGRPLRARFSFGRCSRSTVVLFPRSASVA